jgi:hypothetical protein
MSYSPMGPRSLRSISVLVTLATACGFAPRSFAADPQPGPPLQIVRATGEIVADGELDDAGWQNVTPVTQWFETRVGDNVEPPVANAAYLAYDDKYLYAAFRFDDPNPRSIRAPLGDHDQLSGATDYAGLIVDSRNDGKTAAMFLANARGLQYDALTSDASGEDSSPDFFWDAAGKITETGWTLEIRVPFSSLRYDNDPEQTWGLLLYRNYPRDRRYQFFSARLPRDVNCFVCNSSKLSGLASLPHGSHLVVAPFATGSQSSTPEGGVLGSRLKSEDFESDGGVDVKWNPAAGVAIDATFNPDFSQVESDAAQIVANERFALFFPEKRPFFLEGVDLFSTPLQAAYTRTVTDPSGGLRATGRIGATAYTALATRDHGGGLVILPGPQGSGAAFQDFRSDVAIARVRHDLGRSFVSMLATAREIRGGGHNRVFGPDVEWRPRGTDNIRAQALWSESRTPNRTDLASEWTGQTLEDRALFASWGHSTRTHDWYVHGQDLGRDFRADNGFIPQVGYREAYLEGGYTIRPKEAFLNRVRFFTVNWVDADEDGDVISQRLALGIGMDGRLASFTRIELNLDDIRVGDRLLQRFRPRLYAEATPSRMFSNLSLDAYVGEEIDFANGREGTGTTLLAAATMRPNDHLELRANASRRWLNVDEPGFSGRLFTADVQRLRATWSFSSRSFIRVIGQYVHTKRDPALFLFEVPVKEATFSTSALFAYKLNWQTVLYAGYGDQREHSETSGDLEESGRQVFAKMSYAWQP